MDDQRVVGGTAFCQKYFLDRLFIQCIGTQTVNGFRRECYGLTLGKEFCSKMQIVGFDA